jgi:hypothetical protein
MRTILLIGAAAAAGLMIAGCADEGYYGGGYGAVGYGYDYAGPSEVWYDGYYGPYVDGYWDTGGVFFYRDNGGAYHRDTGGHFRNRSFQGSQRYRSSSRRRDRDGDNR